MGLTPAWIVRLLASDLRSSRAVGRPTGWVIALSRDSDRRITLQR